MKLPLPHLVLFVFILSGAALASPVRLSAQDTEERAEERDYSQRFSVFTGTGEPASFQDVVRAMAGVEVVLVGEVHTDPVGHWIEARLFGEALSLLDDEGGSGRPLALSLEMFERDVQGIVDEYLDDLITEDQFKASARPWDYYDEDYRPMLEMAKAAGIPVLAANAPRRYVNRVSRLGPEALNELSPWARSTLPPLPYPPPTEAYRGEWNALMANMVMEQQCPPPEGEVVDPEEPPETEVEEADEVKDVEEDVEEEPPHGPPSGMPSHGGSFMENGLQAQTLWDASMAHSITTFLDENPGGLVVHMVGGFHVKNFTGTPEKVQFYRPGTRMLVVHMDTAEDFSTFDPDEHGGRGDFVILTDQSLDLNYQRNCTEGG